jgi:hypothetical protein
MSLPEEDFPEVVGALRARAARDRLPRSLHDDVLGRLSPERTRGWTGQLSVAAVILAALVGLVALPRKANPPALPAASQDADAQRLEDLRREIARVKQEIRKLEEEIARLRKGERPSPVLPPALPWARVSATANEIGLVVLSVGKDDGVSESDRFWLYRNGTFVAQVVIDRVDRKWSAGKVVYRQTDPQVGDDVTRSR